MERRRTLGQQRYRGFTNKGNAYRGARLANLGDLAGPAGGKLLGKLYTACYGSKRIACDIRNTSNYRCVEEYWFGAEWNASEASSISGQLFGNSITYE